MKIEILGTGCGKCSKATKLIEEIIKEIGVEAEVKHITDLAEIVSRGVMKTPAVFVNGEKKCDGKVPSKTEIRAWFE
ncbi:small redox-active disulfide protein 2 [Orenia metallireducens]|uniref:Small redox-active disulfide protein 2 n=1 Tax=Orenia metallireducens TaxID=1413210 RepID=A0A285HHF2_9FIRM|nr:thioredoxin family protein [Orenia metallireducens]PRX27177.1 small redox-active disulfide protein 2 [Orenia metallireducens]SNY35145.1 small redox-active disulfide protein 2 [Orenia metallireducens]